MNSASIRKKYGLELVLFLGSLPLPETRRRDLISSVYRVAELTGCAIAQLCLDPEKIRVALEKVRPAKHRLKLASWANIRSAFASALALAGIADRIPRGVASHDPAWSPLVKAIAKDKRLANGLALFVNWCASNTMAPAAVSDQTVQSFLEWLVRRTIYPRPTDLVCRVPRLWNEAALSVSGWPSTKLEVLSFRKASDRLTWDQLDAALRADAEAYFRTRAKPDPFGDGPARRLANSTLRQQREHIRLGASVLVTAGWSVESLRTLADLVSPEAAKTILRYYFNKADGEPSAFAEAVGKTLLSIARHHVRCGDDHLAELKCILGRLPGLPFDLTEKNKACLRELDCEHRLSTLLNAPEQIIREANGELGSGRIPLVEAQCAIAIDILLVAPLRPQNLARLNFTLHVREPDGPRGRMQLLIPARQTKTRRRDLAFEIPPDVAERLRWYRRRVLPAVGADPKGDIFVTFNGLPKGQATLSQQLTEMLADRVGVAMTPHQFRHLAAKLYLDAHPEDFETIRALLGHAFSKTTLLYAGNGTERASRAYASVVVESRRMLVQNRPTPGKQLRVRKNGATREHGDAHSR